jgi:excisionase family DNA binding protein
MFRNKVRVFEISSTLFYLEDLIMEEHQELFTDKEASKFLRISQTTLWRERKNGKITFRRVASKILYRREDLEGYLEQNKRNATTK